MAVVKVGAGHWLDMTWLDIGALADGETTFSNASRMTLDFGDGAVNEFFGNFSYAQGMLSGGTLTGLQAWADGKFVFELSGFSVGVFDFVDWIEEGDTFGALSGMLAGNDQITGAEGNDALLGFNGNDRIDGAGGDDALSGMEGNDTIYGGAGKDYIVGMEGSDLIEAGWGMDDINGNMGADTVRGGDDADWVRGGKDNDIIYGDGGDDPHLNGNLGDDYVFGGVGNDTAYGGQGVDQLWGQEGNDQLSGDVGADTLSGGAGGDRFLFARGGGSDVVTDFSFSEGDRVRLATGTSYSVRVEDGDTIVDLGGGDMLRLDNVAYTSAGDWLTFG